MQSVSSSHLYGVRVHPMRATERLDVSAAQLPSLRQRFGAGTRHVPLRFLLARLLRLMFVGSGFDAIATTRCGDLRDSRYRPTMNTFDARSAWILFSRKRRAREEASKLN